MAGIIGSRVVVDPLAAFAITVGAVDLSVAMALVTDCAPVPGTARTTRGAGGTGTAGGAGGTGTARGLVSEAGVTAAVAVIHNLEVVRICDGQ